MDQRLSKYLWIIPLVLLIGVYFKNAWVADDAYIIFRSIEQLFAGHGPVWNFGERVQVTTSPLWYFILSFTRVFSPDLYLNVILLSFVLLVTLFFILKASFKEGVFVVLGSLLLMASNAFFDFTSSGLENILAYALIAGYFLVFVRYFQDSAFTESTAQKHRIKQLMILYGLVICVRHDLLLLLFPPSAYVFFTQFKRLSIREWIGLAIISLFPFLAYTLYSTIYYGFPFPNTAYAKLNTGIPRKDLFTQGLLFIKTSSGKDTLTILVILVSLTLNLVKPITPAIRFICLGVLLNLAYVIKVGGDFMMGRFLSYAFLLCAIMLVLWIRKSGNKRFVIYAFSILAAYFVIYPHTPLRSPLYYNETRWINGIADERGFYFNGSSFSQYLKTRKTDEIFPSHSFSEEGVTLSRTDERVIEKTYIGYMGYQIGLDRFIIDPLALSDPLLARLRSQQKWRIGHFERDLPEGYFETIETGVNVIKDPSLKEFYDKLSIITRGERLLSLERLKTILKFNLGHYDHLVEDYETRKAAK